MPDVQLLLPFLSFHPHFADHSDFARGGPPPFPRFAIGHAQHQYLLIYSFSLKSAFCARQSFLPFVAKQYALQ